MSPVDSPPAVRVVLTPDAFGHSLLDSSAEALLLAWRDGRLLPVVNRILVLRYLRLLRQLALPERLLRWWGWWIGSPNKVLITSDPEGAGPGQFYAELARAGGASHIVHWAGNRPAEALTAESGIQWVTPAELMAELDRSATAKSP